MIPKVAFLLNHFIGNSTSYSKCEEQKVGVGQFIICSFQPKGLDLYQKMKNQALSRTFIQLLIVCLHQYIMYFYQCRAIDDRRLSEVFKRPSLTPSHTSTIDSYLSLRDHQGYGRQDHHPQAKLKEKVSSKNLSKQELNKRRLD